MNASHVERVVGVRHEMAEPGRLAQALREIAVEQIGVGQSAKCIAITLGSTEIETQTRR